MKIIRRTLVLIIVLFNALSAYAAVGCTLNDSERDVKRLFPESTGYKTFFLTIKEKGGEPLKLEIEKELGDKLEPVYESIDVPYTFYLALKGKEIIGYVHGVNQKGKYGGMQLILATDLDRKIRDFYYQKISSPEASRFTDKNFTGRFIGLTLEDFVNGRVSVTDPSKSSASDFHATVRGLRKNLILLKKLFIERELNSKENKEAIK
jgi:hypothetical protein